MNELAQLTATDLLEGYRRGEFTPVDAAEAALKAIEDSDSAVNAFVIVEAQQALEAAEASSARWRAIWAACSMKS